MTVTTSTTSDVGGATSDVGTSRRDRQRAATEAEIKAVARRHLAAVGSDGFSLRAIARDMGMTAPGLYRYFASLDDLRQSLCSDFFTDASDAVDDAIRAAGDDVSDRIHAAIRGFRYWAVEHPAEFRLMFQGPDSKHEKDHAPRRFAGLFLELFMRVWAERPLDLEPGLPVPAAVCREMERFAGHIGLDLPEDAMWAFANSWIRLYGVICMEILDQLAFMLDDVEPYFEAELAAVAHGLGLDYRPDAGRRSV